MTDEQHQKFAAAAFDYAISMCIRNTEGAEKDALLCAEEDPSQRNLRAALAVAAGKPWQKLLESAVMEIGVVCTKKFLKKGLGDADDG